MAVAIGSLISIYFDTKKVNQGLIPKTAVQFQETKDVKKNV